MSILATKSGWLIAGKVVKETATFYFFEPVDESKLKKVRKDNAGSSRIFESTDEAEALDWIEE